MQKSLKCYFRPLESKSRNSHQKKCIIEIPVSPLMMALNNHKAISPLLAQITEQDDQTQARRSTVSWGPTTTLLFEVTVINTPRFLKMLWTISWYDAQSDFCHHIYCSLIFTATVTVVSHRVLWCSCSPNSHFDWFVVMHYIVLSRFKRGQQYNSDVSDKYLKDETPCGSKGSLVTVHLNFKAQPGLWERQQPTDPEEERIFAVA